MTEQDRHHEWLQELEHKRQDAYTQTVSGAAFMAEFPNTLTAQEFVDKLFASLGKSPSQPERDQLIAAWSAGAMTRAQVLRKVVERK